MHNASSMQQRPAALCRFFGARAVIVAPQARMGAEHVRGFARLRTAPGVDHVGGGAPASVDMLSVLVDWVERGKAPGDLVVTGQSMEAAPKALRARPLCQWPAWPKYEAGDAADAQSFACTR
jgi:feruloyl esterase